MRIGGLQRRGNQEEQLHLLPIHRIKIHAVFDHQSSKTRLLHACAFGVRNSHPFTKTGRALRFTGKDIPAVLLFIAKAAGRGHQIDQIINHCSFIRQTVLKGNAACGQQIADMHNAAPLRNDPARIVAKIVIWDRFCCTETAHHQLSYGLSMNSQNSWKWLCHALF